MSELLDIVTGDDVLIPVTLMKDGVTFDIDTGASVEAAIVSLDHVNIYLDAVTQNSTTPGADWANSLVMVAFTSVTTATIEDYGRALLEIQVNDSGKRTWFAFINIVQGKIV